MPGLVSARAIDPFDRTAILSGPEFDFQAELPGFVRPRTCRSPSTANPMTRSCTTGHKSVVNTLGVHGSRAESNFDHPKIETMGEAIRRHTGKSLGMVTKTEVQDATLAALVSLYRVARRQARASSRMARLTNSPTSRRSPT